MRVSESVLELCAGHGIEVVASRPAEAVKKYNEALGRAPRRRHFRPGFLVANK
jgi:hypothetical protein